ncbi:MAG: hypothetical protein IPO90_04660 [Flavobacteriales bacterium]|nr:hypothetical protein [Flavobacteriales bacterium]
MRWRVLINWLTVFIWRLRGSYKVWVMHSSNPIRIYAWDNWKEMMPMITSLLSITTEKAYIRSLQAYEHKNGWLGFGRMPWNEESNKRWTTKYLEEPNGQGEVQFFDTEVWAPDWNSWLRTGRTPEIFVKVFGDTGFEGLKNGLIIAMPMYLFKRNEGLVTTQLAKLRSIAPSYRLASTVRAWKGSQSWVITNDIMDMNGREMRRIIGSGGQ